MVGENPGAGGGGNSDAELWQKLADEQAEEEAFIIGAVDQGEELRARAIQAGDNKMAEIANSKERGVRNIVRKIWQTGLARNYYRQKYINEAREEMLEQGTLVTEADAKSQRRFNSDVAESFLSELDGVIDESAGDSRESLEQQHPELHQRIKEIVSQYADGTIADLEEARRMFNEEIKKLKDDKFDGSSLTASNLEDIAIKARDRFENYATIAQNMNAGFEHDDAMERVMRGFDVMYGRRNIERNEVRYNQVDKIVDRISRTKLGSLVSPTSIALSVGAAAAITEFATRRTLSTAMTTIPGLSAMVFGASRESRDFSRDLSRANFDSRFNREFESDKKREKMMRLTYERRGANDTREHLERLLREFGDIENNGGDTTAKRDEILATVTECKVILELEKTNTPILSFSSEVNAPREQLGLIKTFCEAKKLLRDNGVNDLDDRLNPNNGTSAEQARLISDIRDSFTSSRKEKEKLARRAKVGRVAKKAATSFVSGLVIGTAMREVTALFNPNVQGIFEKDGPEGHDYTQKLTACKKLAMMIKGEKTTAGSGNFNFDIPNDDVVSGNSDFSFAKAPDGSYTIMSGGKEIATGLDWNAHDGCLTGASIAKLGEQGIKIDQIGTLKGPDQLVGYTNPAPVRVEKGLQDAIKDKLDGFVHVKRSYWYENDTADFDRNELAAHYFTDPDTGAHGLVTNMVDNGSFHNGVYAGFSNLAQSGNLRLMISATGETQSTPIEVIGKLLPNGQVSFCPEPGSPAAQFFDADGKFIGRFAEICQVLGTEDGVTKIAPLATAVGEGLPSATFEDFIPGEPEPIFEALQVPEYSFSLPEQDVVFPMFLPFIRSTKPMNSSEMRPVEDPTIHGRGGSSGYNGYNGAEVDANRPEVVSPRIAEGKALKTGTEVDWYVREQLKRKQDKDYIDRLQSQVRSCDLLMNLDDKIKTIVTIPVYGPNEMDNIYGTLSQFARQEGVDPDSYGVLLDLNWKFKGGSTPAEIAEIRAKTQKTREAIAKAQHDFPNLKIGVIEQSGHRNIQDVATFMNDAVMVAMDTMIKVGRMSEDHDVVVVRTDADSIGMSSKFVAGYQEAQAKNPKTPIFTGQSWFDVGRQTKAPGFGSIMFLERVQHLLEGTLGRREGDYGDDGQKEIFTEGRNFGYSIKHFAAANCFGFESDGTQGWGGAGSDDLRVGWRIRDAFKDNYANKRYNSTNNDEQFEADTHFIVKTGVSTLVTDDNRQLEFYMRGQNQEAVPIMQDGRRVGEYDEYLSSANSYERDFGGYDANPIRPEAIESFTEDLNDPQRFNQVVEQFEREMESLFTRDSWNKRHMFETTMAWFFGVNKEELPTLYTVEDKPGDDPKLILQSNRSKWFKFTSKGKLALRDALIRRMGDGTNPAIVNTMQQAVRTGTWGGAAYREPIPTPAV